VDWVESTQVPEANAPFDLVLIKVPKTLALLEYQLSVLREICAPETVFIGGGMVKTIHTSTLKLFEKYLGATTSSRAVKKARLIFSQLDAVSVSSTVLPDKVKKATSYTLE
jgi:16S rRNA G1207 methylase RsmC